MRKFIVEVLVVALTSLFYIPLFSIMAWVAFDIAEVDATPRQCLAAGFFGWAILPWRHKK